MFPTCIILPSIFFSLFLSHTIPNRAYNIVNPRKNAPRSALYRFARAWIDIDDVDDEEEKGGEEEQVDAK